MGGDHGGDSEGEGRKAALKAAYIPEVALSTTLPLMQADRLRREYVMEQPWLPNSILPGMGVTIQLVAPAGQSVARNTLLSRGRSLLHVLGKELVLSGRTVRYITMDNLLRIIQKRGHEDEIDFIAEEWEHVLIGRFSPFEMKRSRSKDETYTDREIERIRTFMLERRDRYLPTHVVVECPERVGNCWATDALGTAFMLEWRELSFVFNYGQEDAESAIIDGVER